MMNIITKWNFLEANGARASAVEAATSAKLTS